MAVSMTRRAMDEMGDNGETPLTWTGEYLFTGNALEDGARLLWVYIDSSVPSAGYGEWARIIPDGGGLISTEDPLGDPEGTGE